jgi:hypothetical protein
MTKREKEKVVVAAFGASRHFSRHRDENMMNFLYRLRDQGIITVTDGTVPMIATCLFELAHQTDERAQ